MPKFDENLFARSIALKTEAEFFISAGEEKFSSTSRELTALLRQNTENEARLFAIRESSHAEPTAIKAIEARIKDTSKAIKGLDKELSSHIKKIESYISKSEKILERILGLDAKKHTPLVLRSQTEISKTHDFLRAHNEAAASIKSEIISASEQQRGVERQLQRINLPQELKKQHKEIEKLQKHLMLSFGAAEEDPALMAANKDIISEIRAMLAGISSLVTARATRAGAAIADAPDKPFLAAASGGGGGKPKP